MSGGPSTPALAAAVSGAGGLGFIAAGYKSVDEVAREISAVQASTSRAFGVNIFVPARREADDDAIAAYAETLAAEAERYRVALGEPRWTDDEWAAKLELVRRERPAIVSFTFGCPDREVVSWLQARGISVWITVTTPAEARLAATVGVDALVVQGAEAGGHQSSFEDTDDAPIGLVALLQLVRRTTNLPLVAAGGIGSGAGVAAALALGASAAQIGSALMRTPEAGTSVAHRTALAHDAPTTLTRAFTGRRARGIVNRFVLEHDPRAPQGYPHVHYLTAPIRAAARAADDADAINLWAGQAYRMAEATPAGELVERWASDPALIER